MLSKKKKRPADGLSRIFMAICAAQLLTGCYDLERKIVWSPDGKIAAVIGDEGLHLADSNGGASGLLVDGARLAEWTGGPENESLLVLRYRPFDRWDAAAAVLTDEIREMAITRGDAIMNSLRSGEKWRRHFIERGPATFGWAIDNQWKELLKLYLAARYPDEVAKIEDSDVEGTAVYLGELSIFPRRSGLEIGEPAAVFDGLIGAADELRISPDSGAAITTLTSEGPHEGLWLFPLRGDPMPPILLEKRASGLFPDWTPDGQSIVYARSNAPSKKDEDPDISLGALVKRRVIDEASGNYRADGEIEELAGLLFHPFIRVRCLGDGRILFNAVEARLPATLRDLPQSDQIFQFDPDRPATLTRILPSETLANLPDTVVLFEVSPDERRIVVMDSVESHVHVADLATGEYQTLQSEDLGIVNWMPAWLPTGELCFRGVAADPDEEKKTQPVEVLLWDGHSTRPISENWPDTMRQGTTD